MKPRVSFIDASGKVSPRHCYIYFIKRDSDSENFSYTLIAVHTHILFLRSIPITSPMSRTRGNGMLLPSSLNIRISGSSSASTRHSSTSCTFSSSYLITVKLSLLNLMHIILILLSTLNITVKIIFLSCFNYITILLREFLFKQMNRKGDKYK